MFAAVDRMRGMIQPKMGRQKSVTARRTTEWRDKDKEGKVLAWRLRMRSQEAIFPASRTTQDAAHIFCSFSFPRADLPISSPPIDDLLLSVKKTKVPCGQHDKNASPILVFFSFQLVTAAASGIVLSGSSHSMDRLSRRWSRPKRPGLGWD